VSDAKKRLDEDRLEPTIVPVRRAEVGVAVSGRGAPDALWRRLIPTAAIVVTVVVLIAVFVLLPDWVEQSEPDVVSVTVEPVAPVEQAPVLTPEELAALRTEAEALLAELLEQQQALAARSAASWGDVTWSSYETASRLGDEAFLAEDLQGAVSQYRIALSAGRDLLARSEDIMADALAAGEQAIEGGNADVAKSQFDLVLAVDPENARALAGLERAGRLPDVLEAMRRADGLEQEGNLDEAAGVYREVLAIDPDWERARQALNEINRRISNSQFDSLLAGGFAAIEEGRHERAIEFFNEALVMRPASEVARDGLEQAEQGQLLDAIAMAEIRGLAFERREAWDQAISRYREALETDPTLKFAIDGLARAQGRADLDVKLQALIDSPRLLLTEDVFADAGRMLEQARAIEAPGARLSGQVEQLATLMELASTPIDVTLISDGATEVTVYRVGELGQFTSQSLSLRPGSYTAVGHRVGYRDVRKNFSVLPGAANEPVTVICTEAI
jgi:tetratricopeptide (TPR) repeat protein